MNGMFCRSPTCSLAHLVLSPRQLQQPLCAPYFLSVVQHMLTPLMAFGLHLQGPMAPGLAAVGGPFFPGAGVMFPAAAQHPMQFHMGEPGGGWRPFHVLVCWVLS